MGGGNLARVALLAVFLVTPIACGADEPAAAGGCPEGTDRMAIMGVDPTGGPFETRERAVRARLRVIEKDASDETIAAALIASAPGDDGGTEQIVVETSNGVDVTMVLVPQDPGWDVADTEWCAPGGD